MLQHGDVSSASVMIDPISFGVAAGNVSPSEGIAFSIVPETKMFIVVSPK